MKAAKPTRPVTVGVFSASSPVSATSPGRYARGKAYLTGKGIRVVDGSLCGQRDGYRSGSIRARAAEFNGLLHREDVQILMASIGGNNTNAILPYLDYEYLKRHPKIIIGYSDTTALLLAVYARTGLVTFYGPALASSFGEFPPFVDWTYDGFRQLILERVSLPYTYTMPSVWTEEYIPWNDQDSGKQSRPNRWITV